MLAANKAARAKMYQALPRISTRALAKIRLPTARRCKSVTLFRGPPIIIRTTTANEVKRILFGLSFTTG